jgi:hypothetical protein
MNGKIKIQGMKPAPSIAICETNKYPAIAVLLQLKFHLF